LAEHLEIVGHAKAIDILYQSLYGPLDKECIFNLHRAVQTQIIHDIYQPVGGWKIENNGAYSVTSLNQQVYIEYADPSDVDKLMDNLILYVNSVSPNSIGLEDAAYTYARVHMGFVHIHPFCDGNGTMARLIANLLLLKAGLSPLVISHSMRRQYITCLADYQLATGKLDKGTGVWPDEDRLKGFADFCQSAYAETKKLIQIAENRKS
jgi:Fic family protein